MSRRSQGQAAVSLTPDIPCCSQTHVHMCESSHLEGSYVGDLRYLMAHISPRRCRLPGVFLPVESLHAGMGWGCMETETQSLSSPFFSGSCKDSVSLVTSTLCDKCLTD